MPSDSAPTPAPLFGAAARCLPLSRSLRCTPVRVQFRVMPQHLAEKAAARLHAPAPASAAVAIEGANCPRSYLGNSDIPPVKITTLSAFLPHLLLPLEEGGDALDRLVRIRSLGTDEQLRPVFGSQA